MDKRLKEIVDHFGDQEQFQKIKEELIELVAAICEYEELLHQSEISVADYMKAKAHILEERADVSIVIDELDLIFGFSRSDVRNHREFKINRTLKRIEEKFYEL